MPFFKHSWLQRLFVFLMGWLGFSGPAAAYIDPNAGGMLFQLLAPVMAALVGGWFVLRRWITDLARRTWRRLTGRDVE